MKGSKTTLRKHTLHSRRNSMYFLMLLQGDATCTYEPTALIGTLIHLVIGVDFHVFLQITRCDRSIPTTLHCALERFLTCMRAHVHLQVAVVSGRIRTIGVGTF